MSISYLVLFIVDLGQITPWNLLLLPSLITLDVVWILDKIMETRQREDQQECVDVSKDDRHFLCLAAVLHVFYDQRKKGLTNQPISPP